MYKGLSIGLVLLIAIAGVTMPVISAGVPVYGDGGQGTGSGGLHLIPPHISPQPPHLGDPLPAFPGNPCMPYD